MEKCRRIKSLPSRIRVVIEPDSLVTSKARNRKEASAKLENWAKDVVAFIRDHESMRDALVSLDRDYEPFCSVCESNWDPCEEKDGSRRCRYCGAVVETDQ